MLRVRKSTDRSRLWVNKSACATDVFCADCHRSGVELRAYCDPARKSTAKKWLCHNLAAEEAGLEDEIQDAVGE